MSKLKKNEGFNEYDYLLKILIIGDSGVGKSALLTRFVDQHYSEQYISTIGVDFKIRTIKIDEKIVKLQIWDTAGQERFKAIISSYYRGAHGVLIVYNVTDRESFNNVRKWLNEVNQSLEAQVPILLVGTKNDLQNHRMVSLEEGQKLADSLGIKLIETSAKSNINIEESFYELAQQIKNKHDRGLKISSTQSKSISPLKSYQCSKSCCQI